MGFSRSLLAQGAAMTVIKTAREHGYLPEDAAINVAPELAESEHALFLKMFERLENYVQNREPRELHPDEVSSLFTYVYAKAAEAVTDFQNGQKNKFDTLGMFDGKVPIYAQERLTGYFKKLNFPNECAEHYLEWYRADVELVPVRSGDPLLILFEALKWTFRISCHLAIEFLTIPDDGASSQE